MMQRDRRTTFVGCAASGRFHVPSIKIAIFFNVVPPDDDGSVTQG
jgi:hypothetical protein